MDLMVVVSVVHQLVVLLVVDIIVVIKKIGQMLDMVVTLG
mgnify:CR=1 FL=1